MPKRPASAPMFLQRTPVAEAPVAARAAKTAKPKRVRRWRPSGMRLVPRAKDAYVVIDDLVSEQGDAVAILAVARWPRLDDRGRLVFGAVDDAGSRLAVDPAWFQARVNEARAADPAAPESVRTRALRVGDTFLVRGLVPADPPSWDDLEDVSTAARERAKVALYAAAAAPVDRERADELAIEGEWAPSERTTSASAARADL